MEFGTGYHGYGGGECDKSFKLKLKARNAQRGDWIPSVYQVVVVFRMHR